MGGEIVRKINNNKWNHEMGRERERKREGREGEGRVRKTKVWRKNKGRAAMTRKKER